MPLVSRPGAPVVATSYKFVSPEYFTLLRIPILSGRGFSSAEADAETPVTIVSAAAARALWPGESPLGRTLEVRVERLGEPEGALAGRGEGYETFDVVVVGVAADVVSSMIYEGVDPSHLYLPTSPAGPRARHLLAGGRSVEGLRVDQIQALLRSAHADPLAFEVVPLEEFHESQLFPLITASWIGSTLAVLALCLSVSGLYGVLIYTLGQRTREIGIRVALGATGAAMVRLVMGHSARLAGMGAGIGALLAFGALKGLGAVVPLRSVAWLDPGAFAAAMVLVAAATGAAAFLPAWRAARIDPAETLRAEG
jgi:putative ABC transport system permease protein